MAAPADFRPVFWRGSRPAKDTKPSILDDSFKLESGKYSRNRSFVYIDVGDFSNLVKINPFKTAQNITDALRAKGQYGKIRIYGYANYNTPEYIKCSFDMAEIYLSESEKGAGNTARISSLGMSCLFNAMHSGPNCILLISKDKGLQPVVDALKEEHFKIDLFDPDRFLCFHEPGYKWDTSIRFEPVEEVVCSNCQRGPGEE